MTRFFAFGLMFGIFLQVLAGVPVGADIIIESYPVDPGPFEVTLNAIDYSTKAAISSVTLRVTQEGTLVYGPVTSSSPLVFSLANGVYEVMLENSNYPLTSRFLVADSAADVADGTYDQRFSVTIELAAQGEGVQAHTVQANFVFDEDNDVLSARIWLERDGTMVINSASDANKLGDATVDIYDAVTDAWVTTQSISHPDFTDYVNGVYMLVLSDVTQAGSAVVLTANRTYNARCSINYGGASGTNTSYQSTVAFTITESQSVKKVADQVSVVSTQVAAVENTVVTSGNQDQEDLDLIESQTQEVYEAVKDLPDQMEQVSTQTQATLQTVQEGAATGILNRETQVIIGETVFVRFRANTGVSPLLSVLGPDGALKVVSVPMAEVSTGLYEYALTFAQSWTTEGDYSVICFEPVSGIKDAITLTATFTSLETVSANVNTILRDISSIEPFRQKAEGFQPVFEMIQNSLMDVAQRLANAQPGSAQAQAALQDLESLYNTSKDLGTQLKGLGGTTGYDLDKMYEVSETHKRDYRYLRNKAQELKVLLEINQQLLEGAAQEEPVVKTWIEFI